MPSLTRPGPRVCSGAEGQNYFPRFSRQHCGGSNRNGVLFKAYSNVSARRTLCLRLPRHTFRRLICTPSLTLL